MKRLLTVFLLCAGYLTQAQTSFTTRIGHFERPVVPSGSRAAVDSCGPYFNDYIALGKTSVLYYEPVQTGDAGDFNQYSGRAQRFHAPQEIEVSGVRFYGFQTNPAVDSAMVLVYLWDWDETTDSIGGLFFEDTVWVTHTSYTPILPDVEVNCFFGTSITVTEDYVVGIVTLDDDSLKIMTSSAAAFDGAGEGVSFAYYDNPAYPSFTGWYNSLTTFGASYDLDYLISPRVNYDLHDSFSILDDTICPEVVSAGCITYPQKAVFGDEHYNSDYSPSTSEIVFLWDDFTQNTGLTTACHTYDASGIYDITVLDSLFRYSYGSLSCAVSLTQPIYVLDVPTAAGGFVESGGLTVDFTNTSANSDSVWWDFGDATGTDTDNPSHTYATVGAFTVWLYAYNECFSDTIMFTVNTSDVGLDEGNLVLAIHPNPASHSVVLETVSGASLKIVDLLGRTVLEKQSVDAKELINTSGLSQGTYLVQISNGSVHLCEKLIVQH